MPKIRLEVSAQLNNITSVKTPEDYPWHISFQCTSCGEKRDRPVVISSSDEVDGIRGAVVTMKLTCKLCSRVNDIKIVREGEYTEEQSPNWGEFLLLECRGLQPVDWIASEDVPLEITSVNGPLEDCFLENGEFYGYDEKLAQEATVTEFRTRFKKA